MTDPAASTAGAAGSAAGSATVLDLVEQQAAARPDSTYALATERRAGLTYAVLHTACRDIAAALDARGIAPGETVSVLLPNGLATLTLLLGVMAAGRRVNPVNLLAQPEQMQHVLAHADARLVVTSAEWAERVAALLGRIERPMACVVLDPDAAPQSVASVLSSTAAADPMPAAPRPAEGDTALLMYTSGTTGLPKGVALTQAALVANARAVSREHALGPDDRVLGVLPLYHINAFVVTMLAPLAHGGSVAMAPKFSAARFWAQAAEGRCTWLNVVPTIVSYLLEGRDPRPGSTHALRFCRSASAALPPEHHRAFEARFGIGIIETMGLTETAAPSFSNPLDPARRKIGSVGRASGGEAAVVDASLLPVPDGQTGEIVIRGPHVMRGYYKDEANTAKSFTPDGWLRTGDLGHRDADGYYFVTGRLKVLILKGGEYIAPREIDEALLRHPAVLDAAAVGVPDRHYGQEIMACVVLRDAAVADDTGSVEAQLRDWCHAHLGRYKTPRVFRFVPDLPRGPSGKVQRLKLAEQYPPG